MPTTQIPKSGNCLCVVSRVSITRLASHYSHERNAFTPKELRQMKERAFPKEGLAARIAAKQALAQVLQKHGYPYRLKRNRISILNNAYGTPYFEISDQKASTFIKRHQLTCHVSLSHTRIDGIAVVCGN